ncbi:EmrB/QacA subfamily drug resistance transporter [Sphingomonas vulcanisoli]|uniref:EmrB/QacA subfamily drug resistance transporter n=1 Tax=Sphingomonas vulcanisoli TaxID=1658060 RepID=A0ABX0TVZ0_9SPHN|nr:MFS transporter [Sphingomonas vulcanisoli]NIJ07766.1 EmrB/QacA subfamily drug resistance transporter [Sphingomonas vulcanisoli]
MTETDRTMPDVSVTAIALVVAAGTFMLLLDGAILNTSLPQIARDFHVGAVDMNLGITAYIVSLAVCTPLSAWIADRLGSKTVFAGAIALFTVASVGCAASQTLPVFLAARVAQGIGGAMIIPVGRGIVLRVARSSELLQATALLVWPALMAPVIGPVLGGAITSWVGWRWNFLLNVPLGVIGIALALAILPRSEAPSRRPLDWVGMLLTAAALILLIYGLGRLGGNGPNSALPIVLVIAGAAVFGIAFLWLRRAPHPLIDLETFRIPTFAISTVIAGNLSTIAMSAAPFLIPLMMQEAWGFTPLRAGGWVLCYFLGNLLIKPATTAILRRWGFRQVMIVNGVAIGFTVIACGLLTPGDPKPLIAATLFLAGATRSMQLTGINTLAFSDVPKERRGSASALAAMAQQISMALGVAIGAVAVNLARGAHDATVPGQADFRIAFFFCGAIGAVGGLLCLRLRPDAGAHVSGHAHPVARPAVSAA